MASWDNTDVMCALAIDGFLMVEECTCAQMGVGGVRSRKLLLSAAGPVCGSNCLRDLSSSY